MFFWSPSALKHSILWFQGCSCCRDVTASLFCEACLEHRRHFLAFEKELFFFFELMLVDFESCIRVGCTAFWFRSISTDILFLFSWAFLFLQGSVEDWLGHFYSRLGPVEDWCLHLGGCMCQWKHLDWSLSSCLVVRKTGWVFQDCGSGSLFPWSCFVSVLRSHAPGIPHRLPLPLSALAHCVWGSLGPHRW